MTTGPRPAGQPSGFDRLARVYDALVWVVFGQQLNRASVSLLDRVPTYPPEKPLSILVLGGGTGWLLEPLLRQFKNSRVLYLDASGKMLARASRRMLRQALPGTVEFRLGDETSLRPDEQFDLLLTPFVLDLFTEETLRQIIIPRLRDALRPGGQWLVTDFVRPDVVWQKALLWVMFRFFRLTAGIEADHLSDWSQGLAEAGLTLIERRSAVRGMVSVERWKR